MNILAIGCHPDDLEVGCGGTIARYAREGHKVFMCHVANGNMGHKVIMPEELAAMRKKEAQESAKMLGAEAIALDVGDLLVNNFNEDDVRKLVQVIRYAKPDLIITHDPDDYMRDHIQTSEMAFNASFAATIAHYHTQHGCLDAVPPIIYMDTLAGMGFIPTEYVDITDAIELKLQALQCHDTQIRWLRDHDGIDFLDFVRTCSKYRGLQSGVAYAEGFRPCTRWPRMAAKRLLPG
ncbi:MAG: PIG-L family deacetylase [Oscillospiraceae bacterium]|nr:PIG-L family deacetylase [Oscillospiraceae bacterium]